MKQKNTGENPVFFIYIVYEIALINIYRKNNYQL